MDTPKREEKKQEKQHQHLEVVLLVDENTGVTTYPAFPDGLLSETICRATTRAITITLREKSLIARLITSTTFTLCLGRCLLLL